MAVAHLPLDVALTRSRVQAAANDDDGVGAAARLALGDLAEHANTTADGADLERTLTVKKLKRLKDVGYSIWQCDQRR